MSAKKGSSTTTPKSNQTTISQQSPLNNNQTTPTNNNNNNNNNASMILEEDENAKELSIEFEQQLNELETLLNPFFQLNSEDLHRKLTQQELAQLDIIRAYCINTLFYSMFFCEKKKKRKCLKKAVILFLLFYFLFMFVFLFFSSVFKNTRSINIGTSS